MASRAPDEPSDEERTARGSKSRATARLPRLPHAGQSPVAHR
jgi:hypothetical protein